MSAVKQILTYLRNSILFLIGSILVFASYLCLASLTPWNTTYVGVKDERTLSDGKDTLRLVFIKADPVSFCAFGDSGADYSGSGETLSVGLNWVRSDFFCPDGSTSVRQTFEDAPLNLDDGGNISVTVRMRGLVVGRFDVTRLGHRISFVPHGATKHLVFPSGPVTLPPPLTEVLIPDHIADCLILGDGTYGCPGKPTTLDRELFGSDGPLGPLESGLQKTDLVSGTSLSFPSDYPYPGLFFFTFCDEADRLGTVAAIGVRESRLLFTSQGQYLSLVDQSESASDASRSTGCLALDRQLGLPQPGMRYFIGYSPKSQDQIADQVAQILSLDSSDKADISVIQTKYSSARD